MQSLSTNTHNEMNLCPWRAIDRTQTCFTTRFLFAIFSSGLKRRARFSISRSTDRRLHHGITTTRIQRSIRIAALAHAPGAQAGQLPGQGKASHLTPSYCRPQLMLPRCVGLKAEWMGSCHADVVLCLCRTSCRKGLGQQIPIYASLETVSPCVVIVPFANFCDHLPRSPLRWLGIYSRYRLWPYSHRHNNSATLAQELRTAHHQSSCLAWPRGSHHVVCLEISVSLDQPAGILTQEIYINMDVQTSTTRTRAAHTSAGLTAVSIQRRTVN
jgi:hypothetical protein